MATEQDETNTKEERNDSALYEDDDGYFNLFEHHVGSERFNSEDWAERLKSFENDATTGSGNIRKSTEEFLKMKRDEFWDTHKESIEETKMINEAAEYHEQLTLMRQIEAEQQNQNEIQQQQQLLAQQQAFKRAQQQQQQQQQQQAFKRAQQQQQQQQQQPSLTQLQTLLAQIIQALNQFQIQFNQQTQLIHQNFQQVAFNMQTQLNQAIQTNDNNKIQQLKLQQQNIQQQYEQQLRLLQQQFTVQTQHLQANHLNVKTAIQQTQALQLQQRKLQQIQQFNANQIPEFIPSSQIHKSKPDKPQIYTIKENETHQSKQRTRPHIVDEITTEDPNKTTRRASKGDNDDIFLNNRDNISRHSSNISSVKQRVTSQSISSQISTQSQSKSPQSIAVTNIMSPSISPMKLPSHSSISSPPQGTSIQGTYTNISTPRTGNRMHTQSQHLSFSNTIQIPNALQQQQSPVPILTTQSLPNSPLIMRGRVESLAEISKVSFTPEFKAQRNGKRKKTANKRRVNNQSLNRSLPNSPFNKPRNKLKSKVNDTTGALTPLILNRISPYETNKLNDNTPTFPDIVVGIHDDTHTKDKEREISASETTTLTHTGTTNNMEEKESSSSSSEEDSECLDKSDYSHTRSHMSGIDGSRKDSNTSSLYSYSSMSTVFTGVNDGMLLANNSVYLSKMISTEQYNKMEVVNDIKSLWLQVFSIPVLFDVIITISICWLSHFNFNKNQLGGLLLAITIFNMCGHLMIKGMTSTLSTLCDELYNANCKPLVGIQLQKIMGFSICVTIPMVIGLMQLFSYGISLIYSEDNNISDDFINYMTDGVNYLIFGIPALTMFYVFQRYLQGSHVLHVNGYVACCLIGSIVIELGILIIYESVPSFKNNNNLYNIVLISFITSYWILFILFTICINIYKLHSETFIFQISLKQLFSFKKWCKYLNNGIYKSLLLFCNYWYFDFMIIMAGFKGLDELIAFGILCNIYHIICNIISASEFVAKSLIFRGLLHSNIDYARDSWKYTIFFGFFLSVIIGGIFFLLRENISEHVFSILDSNIQSLINNSWLYLYILIILNGIKYGLIGGAQAMGYIKFVSFINLFSFYIVTIPVYVWISTVYQNSNALYPIYCSILLGVCLNILCLLIFRVFINWQRELDLFTLRAHNQAQSMQQSVEAVHIQLQNYKTQNFGLQAGYNYNRYHKSSHHKKHHSHNHKHHCHHSHNHHKHHSHKHHSHKHKKKIKKHKNIMNIPLQSTMTTMTNSGSINSNFGRINVMPLGRQKTNETYGQSNQSSTGSSLDSRNCKHNNNNNNNNNKGFNYGESNTNNNDNNNNNDLKLIYDEYYLKRQHPSTIKNGRNIKQFKSSHMRRRTFWEDLFDLLKQYCCCCLFDGCCCSICNNDSCCEEWWYYCCGCCCSDSYLKDDYNNIQSNNIQRYERYHSSNSRNSSNNNTNTPYSNYHIDLNNNSKYQIIHEDEQPIKLELNENNNQNRNDNNNNKNGNDLKHSLISNNGHNNNSIGGAHVDYLKHSLASQYDHKFTIKNSQ